MIVKAKDILKNEIKPFLFGVFFSRIMAETANEPISERFYLYTSFRTSRAVFLNDFSLLDYAPILVEQYNKLSGYHNWEIHVGNNNQTQLRFYVENDLEISSSAFYNLIYKKLLMSEWLHTENINAEKEYFIRGYMETRGSIDISFPYITQDYFYANIFELKRVQLLTDMMNLPISYTNFNPRDMQPQFLDGTNMRNTQFRINLFYYAKEIGFINRYKALIFEKAYPGGKRIEREGVIYFDVQLPHKNIDVVFLKYLNFFSNYIYDKDLTKEKISVLREKLGFNDYQSANIGVNRNQTIIELFKNISEDKCAICGTRTTFTQRNTDRQAFEIHHMIPFHNGIQYDNIANLVKLCSTCHSSLKKGRATKETQIQNLISILHQQPVVFEYTSSALGIQNINELAEKLFSLLG